MAQVLPQSDAVSLEAALGIGIGITVLAGLCVVVRIKTNWRSSIIDHVGDVISIIALGFIAGTIESSRLIMTNPSTSLDELIKLNYAVIWVGSIAMWSSKVPLLLIYIQLFGIKTWVRIVSYGVISATAIIYLVFAAVTTARCNPGDSALDLLFITACIQQASDSGFALALTSVLTDVIIFLIPIPIILRLNLSTRRKIGLSIVFSSGLAAIAASAVSANFKQRSRQGDATGTTGAMICTVVDCAVALAVGCVPALYGFWSRTITPSSFYSKLSSISQRSLQRLRTANASASSRNIDTRQPSGSSEHIDHFLSQKLAEDHEDQTSMPVQSQYVSHHSQRDMV